MHDAVSILAAGCSLGLAILNLITQVADFFLQVANHPLQALDLIAALATILELLVAARIVVAAIATIVALRLLVLDVLAALIARVLILPVIITEVA